MMELFRLCILVFWLATAAKAQALRCKEGQDKAVLFVNFDDKSAETGWTLDCDGAEVLNTPIGSLGQQEAGSWYSDAACISPSAVCVLTLMGDGHSDREESYFAMRQGNDTVAFGKLPREADVYWFGDEFMMEEGTSSTSNENAKVDDETGDVPAVARVSSKTDCAEGETKAILFVHFDDKSLATGWSLTCGKDELLDVPIGSLDEEAASWFTDMACVPDTSTCSLTLLGEGNASRKNSYFVFKHGDETVVFDTLPQKSESFCFGLACGTSESSPALSEVVSCTESETMALLSINFDDKSDETGWVLDCDGEIVLDAPVGYFELEAGTWHSETVCVSDESTCMLTLLGSGGSSRKDSYFVLSYGNYTVDFGTLPHESESFCFGADCSKELGVSASPNSETSPVEEGSPATPMVTEPLSCVEDESEVNLFVFFDDRSSETGWTFDCDGQEIFGSPVGSLQQKAGSWYTRNLCISDSSTCTFTLIGEGGSSRKDSYFVLRRGNKTVYFDTLPTATESICFGVDCNDDRESSTDPSVPIMTATAVECGNEETQARLFISFDDRSLETGWSLECDGSTLLSTPVGTLEQEPGSWYTQSVCTSDSSSCWLTVVGNGGSVRTGSFFLLRHGDSTVGFDMLPHDIERYCFGADCDNADSVTGDAVTPGSSMQEIVDSSSQVTGADSEPEASASGLSPTISPTKVPSAEPPTKAPTSVPTNRPTTARPTVRSTAFPTVSTNRPTTARPTVRSTAFPTVSTNRPTTARPTVRSTAFPTASPSMSRSDKRTRVPTPGSSSPLTVSPTTEAFRLQQAENSQAAAAESEGQQNKERRFSRLIRSQNFYIMLVVITAGLILQTVVFCCMRVVQRKRQDEEDEHRHDDDNRITVHHGKSLLDDDTDSLFEADNGSQFDINHRSSTLGQYQK